VKGAQSTTPAGWVTPGAAGRASPDNDRMPLPDGRRSSRTGTRQASSGRHHAR